MAKPEDDKAISQDLTPSPAAIREELDFLRQKISSLAFRGDYTGCIKMIDENMRSLYQKERWPDMFFTILRTYQRCYPSLDKSASFEEHITAQLKKNGIPTVFATLLRGSDSSISWNADYFKDLAVLCESRGDYETALSYCDLAVKLDPSSPTVFVVRGWILDDLEKPAEAVAMFEQALELNSGCHSASHALAKHYVSSNPQLALENIDKAIEFAPTEGPYYETKSKILLRLGDKNAAIACLDEAMERSSYNADYPYQKAEILLSQGKEMAAIAQYRKAMALNEKHIPSLWRLAVLYRDSQPELSLTYINTVTTLEPDNRDAILFKATILGNLGENFEATEQFGKLIELDPKFHEALGAYASLLVHTDSAEAIAYFDRAISIAPKVADYHMGKARAHELLGQIPVAIKEFRQTVALDSKNARAWARLASLIADSKPREAVDCYTKAIALMPENAFYHASKGELLMDMPNGQGEAVTCFNEAVKYDPNNSRLHFLLGKLLEQSGKAASALEHYKQAVALGSDDAGAYYGLARLVLSTDPDLSLININSAISLSPGESEYYYFKSQVLSVLGHDKNAADQLGESLRADSTNSDALKDLSEMSGGDNPQVALMYVNRAIEMSPKNPDYLCTRANLFFNLNMPDKALGQYEEALKLNSKLSDALFGIGRCLSLKDDPKGLEYFNKAIAANSNAANYHAEKAELLTRLNKTSDALASFDAAIALDPENAVYFDKSGALLENLNRVTEACERYRQAVRLSPGCVHAIARLGFLLSDTSPSEALSFINQAIELEPQEYIYHIWAGGILAARGDSSSAADEYKKAALLGGETSDIYYTLGGILLPNMPEAALGYCLRALEMQDENALYHSLCGNIHLALDQNSDALTQFKRAAELDASLHEPREKIADMLFDASSPDVLQAVNAALQANPDCAHCLFTKARILAAQTEGDDYSPAIECLDKALKLKQDYTAARRMLVELLEKNRSFIRLALERRKLAKAVAD